MRLRRRRTILFVDEIHRFNKAQQDAFLPHVESGRITLIGSTTENPSFEIIPALMSRCRVILLHPLTPDEIAEVLRHALFDKERGLGTLGLSLEEEALSLLVQISDGDARAALNALEAAAAMFPQSEAATPPASMDAQTLQNVLQRRALVHDKSGESHYHLISALHKSLRDSDPDGALYWLARMLAGGEDPLYILRRMVRFASEDVGNADPGALRVAMDAMQAFRFLGPPEGELAIAQAALYLATAPKSNSVYRAYDAVRQEVERSGTLPVPLHLRNAPTRLMKQLGYGKGYQYAHDDPDAVVCQEHLPPELKKHRFYRPTDRGHESVIRRRLDTWSRLKRNAIDGKKR
jgi:putative ATPase